jgi:hypothetical protein
MAIAAFIASLCIFSICGQRTEGSKARYGALSSVWTVLVSTVMELHRAFARTCRFSSRHRRCTVLFTFRPCTATVPEGSKAQP